MYKVRSRSVLSMIMICSIFSSLPISPAGAEDNIAGVNEKTIEVLKKQNASAIVSGDRMIWLKPDMLVEMVDIKPGMEIADIGAGVGVFTFPFADKLKDTGKVYAIETYKPNLDCITQATKEKNYKNIVPVLVDPSSSKTFYKTHSFDIIFICDVLVFMFDAHEFLKDIAPSLKKDTGRLFIIETRVPSDFDETDIQGSPELFLTISAMKEDHPIFHRLSKESRDIAAKYDIIAEHADHARLLGTGSQRYASLIRDLNAMLYDQSLFRDLVEYYFTAKNNAQITGSSMENPVFSLPLFKQIPIQHQRYLSLLVSELDEAGAFQKKRDELARQEIRFLRMVNKLLLCSILRVTSLNYILESPSFLISRNETGIISKAKDAGLELVSEHKILSKFFVLEFRRKD